MVEEVSLRLGFDSRPAQKGSAEYKRAAEDIQKAARKTNAAAGGTGDGFDKMKKAANENTRALGGNTRAIRRALRPMGRLERTTRTLAGGFDHVRGRVRRFTADLDRRFGRSIRGARRGIRGLGVALAGLARGIPGGAAVAGIAAPVTAIGAGAGVGVKNFATIETGLVNVQKTTGLTNEEIEKLKVNIFGISEVVPVATKDILGFAAAAGQLGVTGTENITKFADVLSKLSVATDVQGEEGARQLARILKVTKTPTEDVDRFASALVALGNTSAATEQEILNVSTRIAQAVAQFGGAFDAQDVLALATTMRSVGVEAELAGSFSVRAFGAIAQGAFFASEEGDLLRQTLGRTAGELQQLMAQDPKAAFDAFIEGFAKLDQSQAADVLNRLGLDGVRVAPIIATLAQNMDLAAEKAKTAADGWRENSAATIEAQKQAETFTGSMTTLGNQITNATSEIGKGLVPTIVSITERFAEWNKHMAETGQFESIGKGIGAVIKVIGIALWPVIQMFKGLLAVIAVLGDAADWVGRQFEALGAIFDGIDIPDWGKSILRSLGLMEGELDAVKDKADAANRALTDIDTSIFNDDGVTGVLPDAPAPFKAKPLINSDAREKEKKQLEKQKELIADLTAAQKDLNSVLEAELAGNRDKVEALERLANIRKTLIDLGLTEESKAGKRIIQLNEENAALEKQITIARTLAEQSGAADNQRRVNEAMAAGRLTIEEASVALQILNFEQANNIRLTDAQREKWMANADALRNLTGEFETASETTKMKERTAALKDFSEGMSKSGKTADQLAVELEILNEATDRNIDITQGAGKAWADTRREMAETDKQVTKQIDNLKKREDDLKDNIKDIKGEFGDAFKGIINGTESVGDAFQNLADRITDILLDLALEELLNPGTNTGFTDIFNKISGGVFGGQAGSTGSGTFGPASGPSTGVDVTAPGSPDVAAGDIDSVIRAATGGGGIGGILGSIFGGGSRTGGGDDTVVGVNNRLDKIIAILQADGISVGDILGGGANDNFPLPDPSIFNDAGVTGPLEDAVEDFTIWGDQFRSATVDDFTVWGDQFASATGDVFASQGGDFISDLSQVFGEGLSSLGDIVSGLFSALTSGFGGGGGGGGGFGGLLGGIGSIFGGGGGAFTFAGSASAGLASTGLGLLTGHEGGLVNDLPRYHNGGVSGLRPDEVPAILQKGEEVLTAKDPRHRDNGGAGGGVVVNVNFPNARNTDEARQAGSEIAAKAAAAAQRGAQRKGIG